MEELDRCPLCGAGTIAPALDVTDHSVSRERFTLQDCHACGFRFTAPRPAQTEIGRYYQSEDYISHSNSARSLKDRLYQLARRMALRGKHRLVRRYQAEGKVLDIGCGTGEFLAHLMSRGYQVQGVEPSLTAREQAIANHGLPVVPGLDQVPAQEQFHVITLWHVLEHVPDLHATFKKLFALLAEDGLLVIAVPDRESWDAAHYAAHWAAWDVPRHLSHFRRRDVHALLRQHGFQLLRTRRMWMDAPYIALLSEGYRGAGIPGALVKGALLGAWSNLVSLFSQRPTSSSLYLARKAKG